MYQKSARRWLALTALVLGLAPALLAQDSAPKDKPPTERSVLERCQRCRATLSLIAGLRCRFCEKKDRRCQPCQTRASLLDKDLICKRCRGASEVCAGCKAVAEKGCALCLARDLLALKLRCSERAPGREGPRPEEAKDCEYCRRWRASVYATPCRRCSAASRLLRPFEQDKVSGAVERARADLPGFASLKVTARNADAKTRKTVVGELRLLRGKAEVGRGLFILRLEAGGEGRRGFAIKVAEGSDGEAGWDGLELTRVRVFDFWLASGDEKNRPGSEPSSASGGRRRGG